LEQRKRLKKERRRSKMIVVSQKRNYILIGSGAPKHAVEFEFDEDDEDTHF
jgi:hypothetical protein